MRSSDLVETSSIPGKNIPVDLRVWFVALYSGLLGVDASGPRSLQSLDFRFPYLWLVGNGRMVVIVVMIVPHSSIPY